MIASRLLTILLLLQARGRMSARALADHFEVSVRTIHRDIDQLSAAGVPVYADRGRNGGFALTEGYRTRLTGLTQAEAEALFLAGLPGPAAQLGLADSLSAARLKLIAALPAQVQPGAERIAARFHLDPTPWFRPADAHPALRIVAQAVWNAQALTLRYRAAGASDARPWRLWPLGLVLKAGVWYLVAQSGKRVRTYRVANIHDPQILDETFARPADFDLAAYWRTSSQAYEDTVWRHQAEVRLSPAGVRRLELLGPRVVASARETARPDRDGWICCTLPIESLDQGLGELMRLCDDVEVLGPPALRAKMTATLAAMSRRHGARCAAGTTAGARG